MVACVGNGVIKASSLEGGGGGRFGNIHDCMKCIILVLFACANL